jgi:beta-mannosidase
LYSRATGALLSEAFHFPQGRAKAFHAAELQASVSQHEGDWFVDVHSDRLAQSVHVDLDAYRAEDDWFHLAPGLIRRLKLIPRDGITGDTIPSGQIKALGSQRIFEI